LLSERHFSFFFRSGLSQQETDIPLSKSELLSEQTEQTKNEEKCQEQGEDPENDCQLVSVSVLKGNFFPDW